MAHRTFEFHMPAHESVVFDAFHYHFWRSRWDSLVSATHVIGGAACPYVGAITQNAGGGALRGLSMQTQFISFDRPNLAAAAMVKQSFPFTRWAASMRHRATGTNQSVLIYTYTFEAGPPILRRLLEPVVKFAFDWQTTRRFLRLQQFLKQHAQEVVEWQTNESQPHTN
jgi:hypothetical protein